MIKRFHTILCVLVVLIGLNQIAYAQEVSMPDPNLQAAVRNAFRLPQDEPITIQLMQELTKLNAQRAQITDLTGLEHAIYLTNLTLNSNQITDISALTELIELQVLSIHSNQVTDIAPLAELTELQTLWLASNEIDNISALAGLTQLENLFLESNEISDLSALMELTQLAQLSLYSNKISDLSALAGLTELEVLSLGSNQISDLNPLAGLTNLLDLFLNDNEISDLSPLATLTQLESLWLGSNQIGNLSPLATLTQLVNLSLESNKIRFVSALRGLTELESLDLTSNQISSITVLSALPNLEDLYIENNPIDNLFSLHQLIASGVTVDIPTSVSSESQVALTGVIFNEIRNASGDKNDWVELKNISNTDIPLNEWEISLLTREGTTVNSEIDVVVFPDYTLPAGEILLITNTDPTQTTLLRGRNIKTPDIRRGAQHDYLVADKLILPNTQYLLILRSARNKNGTPEAIEDVAGTYFHDKLTADQPLTQGTAWQRAAIAHVGYAVEAWGESGYQAGVGYQPKAPKATCPGTPGYHNNALETDSRRGQISISEVMFTNTIRNQTVPQWIELYNNSHTEAVNLTGWKITIESRHGKQNRHAVFTFKDLNVLPNQTTILVSGTAAKSANLPERRVYNFLIQHFWEYLQKFSDSKMLSPDGFFLQLSTPDSIIVDTVGNLDGDSQTQDTPAWELPAGNTENGARSSILRLFHRTTRMPFDGTEASNWRSAKEAKLGKTTYYGNATDVGNPGYTLGGVLSVTLSYFRAERTTAGVVLKWTTESEVDNAGFYILRSPTKDGEFAVVNSTLIQGAGTTGERSSYTWTDTTAKPNVVYYYRIEDVSYAGDTKQLATVRMKGHVSAGGKLIQTWGDLKTK